MNNSIEVNDRVTCFPENQQYSSISSGKPNKDTINSHIKKRTKTKTSYYSMNDIESIYSHERHINATGKKAIRYNDYNQLKHQRDIEEDNIVTEENLFQSTLHEYPLKNRNNYSRYKHGESKKTRIMIDDNSDENNDSHQNALRVKRDRGKKDGNYEMVTRFKEDGVKNDKLSNNISPVLSDKDKEFFFQNDTNQFLKNNFLFPNMNIPFSRNEEQEDKEIGIGVVNKIGETYDDDDNNNHNSKTEVKKTNNNQPPLQSQPFLKSSKAKSKIIIIEEGGKAKVISQNDFSINDSYDSIIESKNKRHNNNYILYHSDKYNNADCRYHDNNSNNY